MRSKASRGTARAPRHYRCIRSILGSHPLTLNELDELSKLGLLRLLLEFHLLKLKLVLLAQLHLLVPPLLLLLLLRHRRIRRSFC